jgi:rhodanese-related sulfurtransferase
VSFFGKKRMNISFFRSSLMAGVVATSGLAGWVQAVEETPYTLAGGQYVTTAAAHALWQQNVMFVDTRVKTEFVEKRIARSVSITYRETHPRVSTVSEEDRFDVAALPADKATPIVFYCNGSPCWRGYKAAQKAIELGYTGVHWYRDGLPAWVSAGHPVE